MGNDVTYLLNDMEKELSHGICVSNLAVLVARELGLPEEQCYELAVAGMLHDVGKLEVCKYIYQKGDTLKIEEMRYVRSHATMGYAMLAKDQYSRFILESILYHHENYDGTGYPANRAGEDIPIGARILRVCDVFAALVSDRPYRRSFSLDAAIELMIEEVKNFDMKIFLAFLKVIHQEGIEELLDKSQLEINFEEDILE
jgi:putative nucleotidyltransferase with HDIG domain